MTNGNERGVATARDRESQVGFADLDFGPFGSDEITLWLFPLDKDPFDFDIWLGMPGEGSKLATVSYDKGSIWNTYQEVTYKLPKRVAGIQALCFVFRQKVHIKGFRFARQAKAYAKIPFVAYSHIYGDSFVVTDHAIENIGNNVTITFNDMDFDKSTQQIEICWHSKQDKNTIMVVLADEEGSEQSATLTLPAQENFASTKLVLDRPLNGKGALNFIFLPGSDIDLEWFQWD